jgi:3'(2'), 5'-bisphosphate nucleotidase
MPENDDQTAPVAASRQKLARSFGAIAVEAGREILRIRAGMLAVRTKEDSSPVTNADETAEALILAALAALCPGVPVIAEEAVAAGKRPQTDQEFLLVDPLDGTREFVSGLDEFTVNIAFISRGAPVAGVVYAPATGELWCGASAEDGSRTAWKCPVIEPGTRAQIGGERPISTRVWNEGTSVALVSRAHEDQRAANFLRSCGIVTMKKSGSSLKFCRIAEGDADIYPRFGRINEWDIAAGDAVLRAAGGIVLREDGSPQLYGDTGFSSPCFVAFGDAQAAAELIARVAG